MENPLLIVIFIALGILEDWSVVWLAFIAVGLAGFVLLGRLSGENPGRVSIVGVLGPIWALMLFAFADWWWQMGYLY
jgi:hypothetical protein